MGSGGVPHSLLFPFCCVWKGNHSERRHTMEERRGEAFELGEQLTVVGRKLQPGEQAPDFALDHVDPANSSASVIGLADSAGKVRLLNIVNSLDTPVCHVETRHWDKLRAELPPDVVVY